MEKTKDFSTKLVIVLVIAVLALVVIVYFFEKDWSEKNVMISNDGIVNEILEDETNDEEFVIEEEFQANDEAESIGGETEAPLREEVVLGSVCGNGIVEGDEHCDGKQIADWYVGTCDPSKYTNQCNSSCKMECVPKPGVCGNGIVDVGEQCDGVNLRTYSELVELFSADVLPICGCPPNTQTIYTCKNDCTQTCRCK